MASAGRILIMPKGDWNSETEYEMLDLVKHNKTSWLAKKTCAGIEPSDENAEYWHKFVDLDADDIGAIRRSGYRYYDGNVDELKTAGTYHVVTPNDKVTGTLPMPDGYWYTINVFADGTGSVVQIWVVATAAGTQSRIFIRHFGGSSWYPYFDVANALDYLKLTGGTLSGSVIINSEWASLSLMDATGRRAFFEKNPETNALSIYNYLDSNNHNNLMIASETTDTEESIVLRKVVNGSSSVYKLFGEHNINSLKPYIDQMIADYLSNNS